MDPRLAIKVFPLVAKVPWLRLAATRFTDDGSTFVTITFAAANGPWFKTDRL